MQGVEKRASRRRVVVVVVWVGFCRASEIAAVYLTQPTEIPFHLASRIYRVAFFPYTPRDIAVSRFIPLSTLVLGHPPQLFLVDSYLFHSRHSHRVRDLSASPIGPQLTEISCGAPGGSGVTYHRTLIRQPSNTPLHGVAFRITQSFPPGHRSTSIRRRTASSECARRAVSHRMLSLVDKSFSYPHTSRQVSFMIRIASLTRI